MSRIFKGILGVALMTGGASSVYAAAIASDSAANYGGSNPNWTNGSNQGTGFQPWEFGGNNGGNFYYTSSSTSNGGGPTNIDTAGVSWGMSVGDGNFIEATRPFQSGGDNNSSSLGVGQAIKLSFDNGGINGTVGFSLRDSSNNNRFEYYYTGGNPTGTYTVASATGQQTAHTFTDGGMNLTFTLTSPDTYSFQVDWLTGTPTTETFTGTLSGASGTGIDRVRLFDFNGGYGEGSNQYFNSLSVSAVPEPASTGLLVLGGALTLARRRRHA